MSGTTEVLGLPYPEDTDPVANYPTTGQALANAVERAILAGGGGGGGDGGGGVPLGTIVAWSGTFDDVPVGWQVCDGGPALSQGLAVIVGTTVPDLRDRFVLGAGSRAPGAQGGASEVVLTGHQMPSHAHGGATVGGPWVNGPLLRVLEVAGLALEGNHMAGRGSANYHDYTEGAPFPTHAHAIQADGGNGAHENMPPFYALAWIIKHTGAAANGITMDEAEAVFQPRGDYLTRTEGQATFQPRGDYPTRAEVDYRGIHRTQVGSVVVGGSTTYDIPSDIWTAHAVTATSGDTNAGVWHVGGMLAVAAGVVRVWLYSPGGAGITGTQRLNFMVSGFGSVSQNIPG